MIASALIVDDSASQLSILEAQLADLGVHTLVKARDGKEALELLNHQPYRFQLVVTDLKMPVMDGMQLIESISDTGYVGAVAIYSSLENRVVKLAIDLAREHQVHLIGNLTKPFEAEHLLSLLERAGRIHAMAMCSGQFSKQKVLIESIEKGLITPYFQPQVDSHTLELVGLEILCRIKAPGEMEFLRPELFIPIVEKHGLMDLLTYKTLEQALSDFSNVKSDIPGSENLNISLNVLPQQLTNDKLPEMIATICDLAEFPKERLIIEITEGQALDTTKKIMTLERLRIAGFGVSLDDFGTGFTNMGQIRQYPFTEIKIDRSMIQNIYDDRVSQVILNTMLELSDNFDLNIVAEGVEKEAEFNYLGSKGRMTLQGYLISRPKPAEELGRWYSAWLRQFKQSGTSS
ncbi:MAG: EAL domain-containing response regulator [Agarilytica sp.]